MTEIAQMVELLRAIEARLAHIEELLADGIAYRKYLKPTPASEKLGITPGTLANWRWQGIGPPHYRVAGLVLYRDDEIDAWVAAGGRNA